MENNHSISIDSGIGNLIEELEAENANLKAQLAACVCGPRRTDEPPKDGTVILAGWYKGNSCSTISWQNIKGRAGWCVIMDFARLKDDPDWWAEIKEEAEK